MFAFSAASPQQKALVHLSLVSSIVPISVKTVLCLLPLSAYHTALVRAEDSYGLSLVLLTSSEEANSPGTVFGLLQSTVYFCTQT